MTPWWIISTWDWVHFWIYLLKHNWWSNKTGPIDRYKQAQQFWGFFWTIWRTGAKLQVPFNLANCSNYNNKLCQDSSVSFFFGKVNKGHLKLVHVNYLKLLDLVILYYILLKSLKGLELVSSVQHWAKNMLKIFAIHQTSIWLNFILIVLRIQKK